LIVVLVIIIGIEYSLTPLSFLQPYSQTLNSVFLVIEILGAFVVTRVSNLITEYCADKTSKPGVNKHNLVFMLKKII